MNLRLVPAALALTAAAIVAAVGVHPAAAAPKAPAKPAASAAASPSPAASTTATPEPLDQAIPRLEKALKSDPTNKQNQTELAADYIQINRPEDRKSTRLNS